MCVCLSECIDMMRFADRITEPTVSKIKCVKLLHTVYKFCRFRAATLLLLQLLNVTL